MKNKALILTSKLVQDHEFIYPFIDLKKKDSTYTRVMEIKIKSLDILELKYHQKKMIR